MMNMVTCQAIYSKTRKKLWLREGLIILCGVDLNSNCCIMILGRFSETERGESWDWLCQEDEAEN